MGEEEEEELVDEEFVRVTVKVVVGSIADIALVNFCLDRVNCEAP